MTASKSDIVQEAIDVAIGERGEIGVQVAAYLDSELVIDQWGGLADETTGREVDGDTLFQVFSNVKAVTATALHIQAERGLVDYYQPVAKYWPEFGAHGKDKGTVFDALTHRIGVPLMPVGVTPELMCDWEWMVGQLADMHPLFEPGTRSGYMAYTFGWVVGEVVRRTDPQHRGVGEFIQEEICQPLGIDSLWAGIPAEAAPRVAKLTNIPPPPPGAPGVPPDSLRPRATPPEVATTQEVFGRSDVRQACIPGAQGIMNARSQARFYAMLANGGELDGVRLLSEHRVRTFHVPRPPSDYDPVSGAPHNGTIGGFHFAGSPGMGAMGSNPLAFGHNGAGGSLGWADPTHRLAVAIQHNRMVAHGPPGESPLTPIGTAVRKALGVPE